jgi:iron complex transport system substrate-binding protein
LAIKNRKSKDSVDALPPAFYPHRVRLKGILVFLLLGLPALQGAPPPSNPNPAPASPPQRIVSINLVSDIILLDLVPPERIVALSALAADPDTSPVAQRASAFRQTRGQAEEILPLQADLVVGVPWGQGRTLQLLSQVGIPVHYLHLANSYQEIESIIRSLATAVGENERGETLIAGMRERLATLRKPPKPLYGSAIWLGQGGFHNGENTLSREILLDAGWLPLGKGPSSLESLVQNPPSAIIETRYLSEHPTLASNLRQHPALRHLRARTLVIRLADFLSATHLIPSVPEDLRKQSSP